MNTIISSTFSQLKEIAHPTVSKSDATGSFHDLMRQYTDTDNSTGPDTPASTEPLLVGEITAQNPTVSELLMQHDELRSSTWNILEAEQNKNRDYTKIQPGTRIYYNQEDGELSWSNDTTETAVASQISPQPVLAAPYPPYQPADLTQQQPEEGTQFTLGRTSERFPTVSHLLKNHPELRDKTWELIANDVNADKPFHAIPSGTEIYFNNDTMEISWKGEQTTVAATSSQPNTESATSLSPPSAPQNHTTPATDLSQAVQQYLGTPYEKINCYELIVKGLGQMNIPYSGKGGLYTELTKMAKDHGMASNAYLNGEGIVKAAGTLVLSQKYSGKGNWEDEAASLISTVEPLLDNGQILSFSTRKRGHTGIVSRQNDQWTFINSGRLDNSVTTDSVGKGVGEEVLKEEIRNWFKLAHANNESLSVTLGQLEHEKIRTTLHVPDTFQNPKRT
ncbi:hypothetical protein [Desulforhopalus sp. IMCC35007]|uniref:hypothetical protein n=1 Tax=Desulforhopalus sp. IMCC35007 TaxID=2569543 RepID=UPI0010ADA968|nr:hypothetical protein [Desulforhopalus sp. IMCC35007]TKB07142.1 hypothetical protein FCL48_18010 [Desulforhopalus sp. IMCC35007]